AMLSYFWWTFEYFDWGRSGLTDQQHMADYRTARRVSAVVTCNEQRYSPEERERAVRLVFEHQQDTCRISGDVLNEPPSDDAHLTPDIGTQPEACCNGTVELPPLAATQLTESLEGV